MFYHATKDVMTMTTTGYYASKDAILLVENGSIYSQFDFFLNMHPSICSESHFISLIGPISLTLLTSAIKLSIT